VAEGKSDLLDIKKEMTGDRKAQFFLLKMEKNNNIPTRSSKGMQNPREYVLLRSDKKKQAELQRLS